MPTVPRPIRVAMSCSLALVATTRPLSIANARIRQKPSAALRTRTLLAHDAADHLQHRIDYAR
jgi:hypothetical protein